MLNRSTYTLDTLDELLDSTGTAKGPVLYGVLGFPIAHSRSPVMQAAAFASHGIAARYVRVETPLEYLPEVITSLRRLGFQGWNCTLPLKTAMLALVDEPDASARRASAVNTVRVRQGKLLGTSTDGHGWATAVEEAFGKKVGDLRLMILGAGGSGQTLALEAQYLGSPRVVIVNRSLARAQALVELLTRNGPAGSAKAVPWENQPLRNELKEIDLVVNTTSVGMQPGESSPLDPSLFSAHLLYYDLIYRTPETDFVLCARKNGAKAASGLGMLLHQGAAAFTWWTGLPAPLETMQRALSNPPPLN